jgi:lipoprotein-anchoring transpeptidase ErfK/SrfK
MSPRIPIGRVAPRVLIAAAALLTIVAVPLGAQRGAGAGQGGRGTAQATPPTPQASAPIDVTGYWVSIIVDEWRFRVTPQKGDINYLPLNNEARQMANAWDPAKDEAEGKPCKAYGAVGVMQRPGRIHVTWDNPTTLKIEADAGTQTRVLHFGAAPADKGQPSWQGYSVAAWELPGGRGRRGAPSLGAADNLPDRPAGLGSLKVVTTNMLPGYIRKNGVPYSGNAVLTEYFNRLTGQQNDSYIALTAMVDDPTYLTGQFIRTYTFKKLPDATGWEPTPCWNR